MTMKKIKAIRCTEVAKYVCENLDEQIDSPLCRKIKKHLQECPDCAAQLRSLKNTVGLYRRYPAPALPADCHKNLMTALSAITRTR
ncbi:MAG: hypothetical protein EHM64_01420 [Ignavibacteriae bacterium]|nr:MAG: hypothetical protein EHM64_01420 [Ignavibacteriota bacterium]